MFASVDHTAAPAATYQSAPALTPSIAVQDARAIVAQALDVRARARFRRTWLKMAGPHYVFCGQVNVVFTSGPSGWKDVLIAVSDDPDLHGFIVDKGPTQSHLIHRVCTGAAAVDRKDYSATLSVW